ncbi:hypothetical protein ncot_19225 [Nocardioides sp. JQ2195]|uniref:hypothetical protein n=1 Tax=Nocardioides sp. JQ2195 TaxID=2592334 RepID=UPI00143E268E|nr:hypothetical protein [Nocardioides sp. JQ2195]QIX28484.1 hypothetical protein ncot_19225 [Nocardioides sp. JQ2195]
MTRSRRLAVPLGAGLAAACLLAPAAAHESSADEKPIVLGDSYDTTTVVEPGLHPFVPPASNAEGYLSVERTIDNSTIWLGETLLSPEPVETSYFVRPTTDESGQSCGTGWSVEATYYFHEFLGGGGFGSAACRKSDQVTFVHNGPLEGDLSGAEAQLVVWEEPPVTDRSILPPPAITSKWSAKAPPAKGTVELGTDFASAPELAGGRWDVHVDPGRTALFKVPLDWNQHMQVHLTYDGVRTEQSVPIEPVLITPIGATSYWGDHFAGKDVEAPDFTDLNLAYSGPEGAGAVSPSITWRNREESGIKAAFPGNYYVLLRMNKNNVDDKANPKNGADITVGVKVITDKPPRSPYSQDPEPIPDLNGEEPADEESETKASDSSSSADTTSWGAVGGLFGGSAVMAAAGFVALGKHRRSRA